MEQGAELLYVPREFTGDNMAGKTRGFLFSFVVLIAGGFALSVFAQDV
jgi:hypothetical protein